MSVVGRPHALGGELRLPIRISVVAELVSLYYRSEASFGVVGDRLGKGGRVGVRSAVAMLQHRRFVLQSEEEAATRR